MNMQAEILGWSNVGVFAGALCSSLASSNGSSRKRIERSPAPVMCALACLHAALASLGLSILSAIQSR